MGYDVERTAQAILATDLPAEFADQVREARGYPADGGPDLTLAVR